MADEIHETELEVVTDNTPPARDAPDHIRCKWWRENIMKLSRPKLAELTGFSQSTIADIEAGVNRTTKATIDPSVMQRYRLACAAVALGAQFDWLSLSVVPTVPVEIRMIGHVTP